jgi:hypothetical protein
MEIYKPSLMLMPTGLKLNVKIFSPFDIEVQNLDLILYTSAIGSFIHVTIYTQFDITFAINNIAQFMANPLPTH